MIYFIAGEVSGDMMGAQVMRQIKDLNPTVCFEGVGGSNMTFEGVDSLFPMEELSLMGFLEIIPHILHIKKRIRQTVEDIKSKKPDVVVTIDSPGFCYRVAALLKRECPEIKLLHVVAPSVWVYKPGRAKKFAEVYDHLLTLLPFEPQYFEKEGLKTTYIGHPIFDTVFGDTQNFRTKHKIKDDSKLVVVTPGSRKGELIMHLPPFIAALNNVARFYEDFTCCFVLTSNNALVKEYLKKANFNYVIVSHQERLQAYAAADVALAKSGTNTLEIAASKTPMVVAYKLNFLTGVIIKLTAKVKYASLINIMGGREIIPEFLQSDCNEQLLAIAIRNILDNDVIASKQIADSLAVLKSMGLSAKNSPSKIAAKVIMEL